ATVLAPLDWEDPDGATIELALARVKATDEDGRLGSLLLNPGGPGGSGKTALPSLLGGIGEEVKARYDVVGFDPRGVGESTPVTCYETTEQRDAYFGAEWPRTAEGFEESLAVAQPFAEACGENTGPLLGHVDTVSAARDMDLLREILGDEKLNYLGYSYGTALGATYAELFPENVGRLVLDGAIDPSVPAGQREVEQAAGFEASLGAYVEYCLGKESCPFSGTKQQALDEISDLLEAIEAHPLPAGADETRELTVPLALNGILVTLYDDASWPMASQGLDQAINYGDGTMLMALSDIYLDRIAGKYRGNQMEAFVAVNCLDARLVADLASAEAHAAALEEASPTFGRYWAYSEKQCAVWPYPQTGSEHAIAAAGAAPIVVVGTTGDPATPYEGAVALAEQLESGVLITFQGEGHTAYGRSNGCVDAAIDRYFLEGEAPREDLTC
ncbi:MAG: alpha/beta hydrolase, partial [Bifidobacteriaceae bacterium]|nr:alpha/beta hydrolase [Bifidobacteriaceae bacterium]